MCNEPDGHCIDQRVSLKKCKPGWLLAQRAGTLLEDDFCMDYHVANGNVRSGTCQDKQNNQWTFEGATGSLLGL